MFDTQDAEDGYDFIEWLAAQWWCSGKIGMQGNSCVALTQWRIAALCPPHLTCIAPWEADYDLYREVMFDGGIPALSFNNFIINSATGLNGIDDQVANAIRYPHVNEYWDDKVPDVSKVKIPVSCTASWNHFHLYGSIAMFRKCGSRKKWLRCHREQEWPDVYSRESAEELKLFFDRYLKDINNCWESTPRVRLEVEDVLDLDFVTNRPEDAFPLKRTVYKKLWLDASKDSSNPTVPGVTVNKTLSWEQPANEAEAVYSGEEVIKMKTPDGMILIDCDKQPQMNFDIKFEEDTEITGYVWLRLWVSAPKHDDADIFVNLQKLDSKGNFLPVTFLGEPHPGTWGKIRVSARELDEKNTDKKKGIIQLLAARDLKLKPGEIVPVDIQLMPMSRFWHKGQSIRINIAGTYIRDGWFEPLHWDVDNKGDTIIHTGGKYDSFVQIPVVPPRYQDGDIIIR
jgi:predicted acyl esterase